MAHSVSEVVGLSSEAGQTREVVLPCIAMLERQYFLVLRRCLCLFNQCAGVGGGRLRFAGLHKITVQGLVLPQGV